VSFCAYTGVRVSAFFVEPAAAARQLAADSARCAQRLAPAAARARAAAGGGMGLKKRAKMRSVCLVCKF
jgi:hypothetical protein